MMSVREQRARTVDDIMDKGYGSLRIVCYSPAIKPVCMSPYPANIAPHVGFYAKDEARLLPLGSEDVRMPGRYFDLFRKHGH